MANDRERRLLEAVFVSGLWASYGDVAELLGTGARAYAMGTWNRPGRSRLARQNGDSWSTDIEKERRYQAMDRNRDADAVSVAFGYDMRIGGRPFPQKWRATVSDMRMLLGEQVATSALKERVEARREWLRKASVTSEPVREVYEAAGALFHQVP